jgi:hypothetical protein
MKTSFNLLAAIIFTLQLQAQTPSIVWENNYGGSSDDFGKSICMTIDGGLIIAGNTNSIDGNVSGNHGGSDCWLIKLDMNNNIEWQKCYGGSEDESAMSVIQTSDSGFVFTGVSHSSDGDLTHNNGGADIWIVKLNQSGEIVWQKSFGGPLSDIGWHVIESITGDFIVAGQLENPVNFNDTKSLIIKINSNGIIQWEKYFGGSWYENAKCILQTDDEGYVFVGEAYSTDGDLTGNYGMSDCWVVKLDSDGNLIWQNNLGGSSYDYAECIIQNSDGSYIMSGYTRSNDFNVSGNHGETDAWIVKLSSTGGLIWQECYGGSEYDRITSILNNSNSGYIFSGSTNSNDGDVSGLLGSSDFWLGEINNVGDLLWQKCLGGSMSDYSFQKINTGLNEYMIIGVSESNDYNLTGNNGGKDYWAVKIDTEVGMDENLNLRQTFIYPNPTDGMISIQSKTKLFIEIRNTLGEKILFKEIYGTGFLDISDHPNGIYIVQLRDQNNKTIETRKIIKN